jgi:aconitate hydratase
VALVVDQTLTHDATGTTVMLEIEAMELDRVRTELSVQYVDHNLLQTDFKNADDHLFLQSACRKYGLWYSPAGNGVSHPVHMECFGEPGKTLLGSDSHTPAAGALGMLAIGAGGLEVALAMAGEPFRTRMPEIWGLRLEGELPPWVSAKDVILELLRRHDVDGGVGRILEYHGPGLDSLTVWDRHVIANMGTELGATSSVFPADGEVKRFLESMGRGGAWREIVADDGVEWDHEEVIDLSELEPLIACPSSPGNVVPVREVEGREIYQATLGSSANPGPRDFAVPALMCDGESVAPGVSFDVNPTSRRILDQLVEEGYLALLLRAGARLHQAGCNGCIGMGQAPATGRISLRTVPRNFPGRSGTKEDQVYLCSPETATASALRGVITDPRSLGREPPSYVEDGKLVLDPRRYLEAPADDGSSVELVKGPNIEPLPDFDALPEKLEAPVLLKLGDNVSTDEIMPAGTRVLPFRSNIPAISEFVFYQVDADYVKRAKEHQQSGSVIVGGRNYGQGSSREHAAIAPRYLGLRVVLAKSFARIHRENLTNFGILPLCFVDEGDYDRIEQGDRLSFPQLESVVKKGNRLEVRNETRRESFEAEHDLSDEEREVVLSGSVLGLLRNKRG